MRVHVQIASAFTVKSHNECFRQQRQHVIEERNPVDTFALPLPSMVRASEIFVSAVSR